ncbi:MAG: FHA domain-containing protein, partial [Oscillospiraceae bacterium]|nr:FHA domain-containing protein [Oscillospiraceae bacterium]
RCTICGSIIPMDDAVCPVCHQADPYPDFDENGGRGRWVEDYEHCPDCKRAFRDPQDRHCRYCGAARSSEPVRWFKKYRDGMACLYGPMPATLHYRCPACGKRWESSTWDWQYHCPACGASTPALKDRALVLADEKGDWIELPLDRGDHKTLVLGRGAHGAELLTSPYIAREHAVAGFADFEGIFLKDISTNGVYVDGKRLEKGVPVRVALGAKVRLADMSFTLCRAEDMDALDG